MGGAFVQISSARSPSIRIASAPTGIATAAAVALRRAPDPGSSARRASSAAAPTPATSRPIPIDLQKGTTGLDGSEFGGVDRYRICPGTDGMTTCVRLRTVAPLAEVFT